MTVFGVDLSDFDRGRGPVDVAAMARDGIAFLTHKATEGTSIVHRYYAQTLSAARSTSIEFLGAYMVPRTPGNGGAGSIGAQVSYFLSYLDGQTPWWRTDPRFFIQVDTEHWSNANGAYDAVSPAIGAQACALLRQQTGKWVVHYAPRWAYGDTIPGDDPLWASAYGSNPAVPYRQAYPGDNAAGWQPYSGRIPTFLQFGSRATIGSQPGCDINAFRGSLGELRALITGGDDMTPEESQKLRDVWDILTSVTAPDGAKVSAHVALTGLWQGDAACQAWQKAAGDRLAALATPGAPTQDQVDAAVLKAMLNADVQKGIGDAIAAHLHVS